MGFCSDYHCFLNANGSISRSRMGFEMVLPGDIAAWVWVFSYILIFVYSGCTHLLLKIYIIRLLYSH